MHRSLKVKLDILISIITFEPIITYIFFINSLWRANSSGSVFKPKLSRSSCKPKRGYLQTSIDKCFAGQISGMVWPWQIFERWKIKQKKSWKRKERKVRFVAPNLLIIDDGVKKKRLPMKQKSKLLILFRTMWSKRYARI